MGTDIGYDVIGDVHGGFDKLLGLLAGLGYSEVDSVWQHPSRIAVFVGDLVDRKPQQLLVIRLVQAMVAAGRALVVMGNHEFNAIAWFLEDRENSGQYLREHSKKNREQHRAFLLEVESTPEIHAEIIDWFLDMPLWLDLPGFRVVHACWHQEHMSVLLPHLRPGNRLTRELVETASRKGSPIFDAVEVVTKGLEVSLPIGTAYFDNEGHERTNVRVRWWDETANTLRLAAIVNTREMSSLPHAEVHASAIPGYRGEKPLFIGHYWRNGEPFVLSGKVACVDYSAGRYGPLVAYRWDGESILDSKKFAGFGMNGES